MRACTIISYFHRKIGPIVYYSYPEDFLQDEDKARLADVMDKTFEESFFTHKFGDLTSMNYYFEVNSEWARGNKEMLMISFILDVIPNPSVEALIVDLTKTFANKLKKTKNIYKAFYTFEDSGPTEEDGQEIKKFSTDLKFWIKELYWIGIEELRERTEEEKWASVMSKPEIFKVIIKLSKGPLTLEDLRKWFITVFPQLQVDPYITQLEKEKFVFTNAIGQETYVLLVKDVSIMRVPPVCIIDLEEDSPELADLTQIYLNEVRDFFETYKSTPLDSFELFKLFANPKIYSIISQLREGPIPRKKFLSVVSENTLTVLEKNLAQLIEKSIIQEFSYAGETLYLLKTDVILTASFPEYLKSLLRREIKGYVAQSYTPRRVADVSTNIVEENLLDIIEGSNVKDNSSETEKKNPI